MIQSKEDLKRCLEIERRLFLSRNLKDIRRKHPKLFGEYEWKYVISLRYAEYLKNVCVG